MLKVLARGGSILKRNSFPSKRRGFGGVFPRRHVAEWRSAQKTAGWKISIARSFEPSVVNHHQPTFRDRLRTQTPNRKCQTNRVSKPRSGARIKPRAQALGASGK